MCILSHIAPKTPRVSLPRNSIPIDHLEGYAIWRLRVHDSTYGIPLTSYFASPLGTNPYDEGAYRLHISPYLSDHYDREFVRQIVIAGFPSPEEFGLPFEDFIRPAHLNIETAQMRAASARRKVKSLLESPLDVTEDGVICEDEPDLYQDEEGIWRLVDTEEEIESQPMSGFDFLQLFGDVHRYLVAADCDECLGALVHVRQFGPLVTIDTERNLLWTSDTIDNPVSFRDEVGLADVAIELYTC